MISRTEFDGFDPKFDVVSVFIEHDGEILMLHRQDHKPQGNTWSMPAGKVNKEEDLLRALVREVEEETGLQTNHEDYLYSTAYYVRYPEYDYKYHIYHLKVSEKPSINLKLEENKEHIWIRPEEALRLELIPHEDSCIKWFYNLPHSA